MTKRTSIWWVFLLLWVTPLATSAQFSLQELYQQLERSTNVQEKMRLNFQLAELNLTRKPNIATYQARQSYGFAQQLNDRFYQRESSLLLGKTFINQSDEENAKTWFNTARDLGKLHNSASTFLDASTFLSGIEIRRNNYKAAYEYSLDAINFLNQKKGATDISDSDCAIKKASLEKELLALQNQIDLLNISLQEARNLPDNQFAQLDSPETKIIYIDTSSTSAKRDTVIQYISGSEDQRSKLFRWLSILLGILSLGLLTGWFLYGSRSSRKQEEFEYSILKKDRLIRNYREELEENERLRSQSVLGEILNSSKKVDPLNMLVVDLGLISELMNNKSELQIVEFYREVLTDFTLVAKQYPEIFYVKKLGTTLVFASGINPDKNSTEQLLLLAKDIKEYTKGREDFAGKVKIAIHSGSAFLTSSDLNQEALDILGHSFDQCNWMASIVEPGQILVSGKSRELLKNKDRLKFLGIEKDWTFQEIELYELNTDI